MSSILENPSRCNPYHVKYSEEIESFISSVSEDIYDILPDNKKYLSRWVSLKLLDENSSIDVALKTNFGIDIQNNSKIQEKLDLLKSSLNEKGSNISSLRDNIVMTIVSSAEDIRKQTCKFANAKYNNRDRKIDKILTSKKFGIPIMIAFLAVIFWITITGANYPSTLLSNFFGFIQEKLLDLFKYLHIPDFWTNLLIMRNVPNRNMGCLCYASTYGYLLPFVYFA